MLQTRHCSLFLEECFLTLFFWFRCFFCYDVSFNLYDQNVNHAVPCSNSHRVHKTGFTIQNSQFVFSFLFFFYLWHFCHLFVWDETMDHRQSLLNSIFCFVLLVEKKNKKTLVGYICVDEIENGKLSGFFTWN